MVLMNHNLFHRAARREDDSYEESLELPRYMFRFLLYRTTDPKPLRIAHLILYGHFLLEFSIENAERMENCP